MRPQVISQTGIGSTAWIPLDYKQNPFNVGFGCVVNGTLTYQIEHTFDDPYTTASPTAFVHTTVAGLTTNKDSNYAFPVRAIRLNVTSYTSGSVTATVLQGLR